MTIAITDSGDAAFGVKFFSRTIIDPVGKTGSDELIADRAISLANTTPNDIDNEALCPSAGSRFGVGGKGAFERPGIAMAVVSPCEMTRGTAFSFLVSVPKLEISGNNIQPIGATFAPTLIGSAVSFFQLRYLLISANIGSSLAIVVNSRDTLATIPTSKNNAIAAAHLIFTITKKLRTLEILIQPMIERLQYRFFADYIGSYQRNNV